MRSFCPHCNTRLPKKWQAEVIDEGYVLCECGTKIGFRFSHYWGTLVMGLFAGISSYVYPNFGAGNWEKSLMVGLIFATVSFATLYIIRLPTRLQ